jgi:hypothetical protein
MHRAASASRSPRRKPGIPAVGTPNAAATVGNAWKSTFAPLTPGAALSWRHPNQPPMHGRSGDEPRVSAERLGQLQRRPLEVRLGRGGF